MDLRLRATLDSFPDAYAKEELESALRQNAF
jgi:hypothetical protein